MGKYLDLVSDYEINELNEKNQQDRFSQTTTQRNKYEISPEDSSSETYFVNQETQESLSDTLNSSNSFNSYPKEKSKQTIQRLPWKLEQLIHTATNTQLTLSMPGVTNINAYVMSWACTYLVGDKAEALKRLNEVQMVKELSVN